MAGGTFKTYNKIRPGAYINFKSVPKPLSSVGSRGILTMPVAMDWGAELTELYSTDLLDGRSLAKIGYTAFDAEAQIFREPLKHAFKAIVYRLDTGGTKASATIENLVATALYAGTVGNRISVSVKDDGDKFKVFTYVDTIEKDSQKVAKIDELEDNDWVTFSGDGDLIANAGTALSGGTNGTINSGTYASYLNAIQSYDWQVMAIPQSKEEANGTVQGSIISFIENRRENLGRKAQAVLLDPVADYEGIISVSQGYKTVDETISPEVFVAYVAGLTAGADIVTSNTYHVVQGAVDIVYMQDVEPFTHEDIEKALEDGKFVLSVRQDGVIVVEQDINSLHTFTVDKNYEFSKNRVLRTLDEINNSVSLSFEKNYLGKVDSSDYGRSTFKADISTYLVTLQTMGAIQNFDPSEDLEVLAGDKVDSMIVNLSVQPVDSMEKMYMTVNVG